VGLHYFTWRNTEPAESALFIARLTGPNAIPAVDGPASGMAAFVLSDDRQRLSYYLKVNDITSATMAQLHSGANGQIGDVVLWLFDGRSEPFTGDGTLVQGELAAEDLPPGLTLEALIVRLASGEYYVNIPTTANPGGEIRGQVDPARDLVFTAELEPGQEATVPPVVSEAIGQAGLFYDAAAGSLAYTIHVSNALRNPTAAHIHLEQAGQNGPVVAPLATPTSEVSSTGTLTAPQLTGPLAGASLEQLVYALLTGRAYVNVHTIAHPGGEIRGQLGLLSPHAHPVLFYAELRGDDVIPPVETSAGGIAALVWQPDGHFAFTLALYDLSDVTAASIHMGDPEANGPAVATLNVMNSIPPGEFNGVLEASISAEELAGPLAAQSPSRLAYEMLAGNAYISIATLQHPDGALRGQTELPGDITGLFIARLSGAESVPPVGSSGIGIAVFASFRDTTTGEPFMGWRLAVDGVEDMQMSHIHQGGPTDNGPVVANLVQAASGETIDARGLLGVGFIENDNLLGPLDGLTVRSLYNDMAEGNAYVNIHSLSVPSGEIRGVIEPLWLQ
jgi:hypothetical protein